MYELYYWPGIPGRGEFIRLAFEDTGTPFVEVVADPNRGIAEMQRFLASPPETFGVEGPIPLAPPFLRVGRLVLSQVANILQFLGPTLGLVPSDEHGRLRVHQVQLTIADLVLEIHNTHHPIASGLYYEEQQTEALRYTANFLNVRLPKFLSYFERTLVQNGAGNGTHLVGAEHTYADLSLFQVLEGLHYAFPKTMKRLMPSYPALQALRERVAARPLLAAYLASERRRKFNEHGIFRHYPVLEETSVDASAS
jgi:glutathione S-transferase